MFSPTKWIKNNYKMQQKLIINMFKKQYPKETAKIKNFP